jgi:CxxC-x17-CxxC domain-containing protein
MYTDKTLTCRECGTNFTFTAGEQEFFASKGFTNEPSRCPECRGARNRDRGAYGGGSYSGGGGGYERRERQMFPATCSNCGKQTEVPFQPREDRPVYCSDCFETHRPERSGTGRGGNRW